MTKPTHVLFVGATGSIGRLAVAEGLAQGYQVRALVRDTSRAHFDARVNMFEGDLTSIESLKSALDGINGIVFTMGAHDGPSMIEKIDYGAVRNTLLALDGRKVRIALMTAIGVTYMDSKYNRRRSRTRTDCARTGVGAGQRRSRPQNVGAYRRARPGTSRPVSPVRRLGAGCGRLVRRRA